MLLLAMARRFFVFRWVMGAGAGCVRAMWCDQRGKVGGWTHIRVFFLKNGIFS